jgi:hypothetical protein
MPRSGSGSHVRRRIALVHLEDRKGIANLQGGLAKKSHGTPWGTSSAVAVAALSCRSCLIDGEVVICGEDGIPVFDRLRYGRQPQTEARLFAFNLLELGGKDLRRSPLEDRKRQLAKLLRKARRLSPRGDQVVSQFEIRPTIAAIGQPTPARECHRV